jgi:site-specific DNA-cytosine methylase
MIAPFNCVEPCSGYAIAGMGIHKARYKVVYAFDNDCWDEKSQQYKLDAVRNYNLNFKHDDGSDVCERKDIYNVSGEYILDQVSKNSTWKSVHFMFGGPPCVEWSKLNRQKTKTGKNLLTLEYVRLVNEARPLTAVMEQVPDFLHPSKSEDKKIRNQFFHELKNIGYDCAVTVLDASDYRVAQVRRRAFVQLVRSDLNIAPVFPAPVYPKIPITRYIDIDGYSSGHFGENMKAIQLHSQVCTVTSSSPKYFYKGSDVWTPTIPELLWCQSVDPNLYKYVGSISKLKKGIGNGVPANLAYHIAKCIMEMILEPAYRKYPHLF